nr:hypothetical protein [Kibdelosporangium sp. MJ126-NF4]CEL21310.1 hypothetical protein [Kibdelosporangium sp. MJ126-NF4]CTQ96123.1 hypothetical protein [Kibdelosporangium sp. MJ126-NF4]
MDSLEATPVVPASGTVAKRWEKYQKFARLLLRDRLCLRTLALALGVIASPVIERGGS